MIFVSLNFALQAMPTGYWEWLTALGLQQHVRSCMCSCSSGH